MGFAERLKEARLAAGLDQKELGALIGVTGNAVSNYESGTSSPKDSVLLKIFDALMVEPNFLFQDSFTFTNKKAPARRQGLTKEEETLLANYQNASPEHKSALQSLAACASKLTVLSAHAETNGESVEEIVSDWMRELPGLPADTPESAAE